MKEIKTKTISTIRRKDLHNLVQIRGMVKRKSKPFSKVFSESYICSNSKCQWYDTELEKSFPIEYQRLKVCPDCESKLTFVSQQKKDYQVYVLEELQEELSNPNLQPMRMTIYMSGMLTNQEINDNIIVGSKVSLIGTILEESFKNKRNNEKNYEFVMFGESIDTLESNESESEITEEDIEDFHKFIREEDTKQKIVRSIAPKLHGMEKEKEGVVLSLLEGSQSKKNRNKSHILFVGEPARGKSEILRYLNDLHTKSVYVSGEGSSGVGLTGAAVKDEFSGGWTVEGGAIVHAHGGLFLLDELDKVVREEQTKINTALEDGKVNITKAGINAELLADATTIACANPRYGVFDDNVDVNKQITIESTLYTRFDLVFLLKDTKNSEEDESIAMKIFEEDIENESVSMDYLRKFFHYARSFNPRHTKETRDFFVNVYKKMRQMSDRNSISFTPRQLGGLKRLSEAHAKLFLRDEVTIEDCKAATELMGYCLRKLGVSELETGQTSNTRNVIQSIEIAISQLESREEAPTEENIFEELSVMGSNINKAKFETYLEQMKKEGHIFQPRKNVYKIVN